MEKQKKRKKIPVPTVIEPMSDDVRLKAISTMKAIGYTDNIIERTVLFLNDHNYPDTWKCHPVFLEIASYVSGNMWTGLPCYGTAADNVRDLRLWVISHKYHSRLAWKMLNRGAKLPQWKWEQRNAERKTDPEIKRAKKDLVFLKQYVRRMKKEITAMKRLPPGLDGLLNWASDRFSRQGYIAVRVDNLRTLQTYCVEKKIALKQFGFGTSNVKVMDWRVRQLQINSGKMSTKSGFLVTHDYLYCPGFNSDSTRSQFDFGDVHPKHLVPVSEKLAREICPSSGWRCASHSWTVVATPTNIEYQRGKSHRFRGRYKTVRQGDFCAYVRSVAFIKSERELDYCLHETRYTRILPDGYAWRYAAHGSSEIDAEDSISYSACGIEAYKTDAAATGLLVTADSLLDKKFPAQILDLLNYNWSAGVVDKPEIV